MMMMVSTSQNIKEHSITKIYNNVNDTKQLIASQCFNTISNQVLELDRGKLTLR